MYLEFIQNKAIDTLAQCAQITETTSCVFWRSSGILRFMNSTQHANDSGGTQEMSHCLYTFFVLYLIRFQFPGFTRIHALISKKSDQYKHMIEITFYTLKLVDNGFYFHNTDLYHEYKHSPPLQPHDRSESLLSTASR